MAINCDPNLYAYAGPLDQCVWFPVGKTPTVMFASFTGIEIGQGWAPPDPPAPNITLELAQIAPCIWQLVDPDFNCAFTLSDPASLVFFSSIFPNPIFFLHQGALGGTFVFVSTIPDVPGIPYFGGTCILQSPLDDDIRSLQTVLQALNIDPAQPTYDTPRALDATESWHTIGNEDDTTVVKIKFDHT